MNLALSSLALSSLVVQPRVCRTWSKTQKKDLFNAAPLGRDMIKQSEAVCASSESQAHMSLVMRKPAFCICQNKDADQLRGNREADQRLCFRYTDSTITLLSKSEISSL